MKKQGIRGSGVSVLVLALALPFCMGGCPEFRNDAIDAFETATRGLINAAVDLYFDQYRSDNAL